jgi:hypothetical protein
MPPLRFISALPCLLVVFTACAGSPKPEAGPEPSQSVLFAPAGVVGDTVWVLLTPVRADRREEFERLMKALYRRGTDFGSRQDSVVLRTFRRTRMLRPVSPNSDGSYTYVFLPDPRVPGADYDLETLLPRLMPADSARAFLEQWRASLAGEQQDVLTVQLLPRP